MTQESVYLRLDQVLVGDVLILLDGSEETVVHVCHTSNYVALTVRDAKGESGLRGELGDLLCEIRPRVPAPTRWDRDAVL